MPYQTPNQIPSQFRSLYRSILRELSARPSLNCTILSDPSPLQCRIRQVFSSINSQSVNSVNSEQSLQSLADNVSSQRAARGYSARPDRQLREGEQYLQYLRAQRKYLTLLERYNPGANMDEEKRVRLTARRVGMELPDTGK